MSHSVIKIISGGQCGADTAGLLAAQILDMETGGFAPKNWMTEEGPQMHFLKSFGLKECFVKGYGARTILNVDLADGTVIFGKLNSKGSQLTINTCADHNKPNLHLDVPWNMQDRKRYFLDWLHRNKIAVLNCAGNRESVNTGIGDAVCRFLVETLG